MAAGVPPGGNFCRVLGAPRSGKGHLIAELRDPSQAPPDAPQLRLESKYYSASVRLLKGQEEARAAAQAWVVVARPCEGSFAEARAAHSDILEAPSGAVPAQRLLVVNEAEAGDEGLAPNWCCRPDVVDWCLEHGFEAVPRPRGAPGFDRAAALRRGLLEQELGGAARVYQALGSTVWPVRDGGAAPRQTLVHRQGGSQQRPPLAAPAELPANLCVILWAPCDGPPREPLLLGLGARRAHGGWAVPLSTKYYSAEVAVCGCSSDDAAEARRLLSAAHAAVVVFSSPQGFAEATAGAGAALQGRELEVGVLLSDGPDCVDSAQAWGWAHSAMFEYARECPEGCGEEGEEAEGLARCREALAATIWPQHAPPPETRPAAPPQHQQDRPPQQTAEAAEYSRLEIRSASGVGGALGCDLPPGWIFDRSHDRSRRLSPLRHLGFGEDEAAGEEADPTADFDRLFREAKFLRQHGGAMDPEERRARAAQIALRMAGIDDDDKASP
eukprot:TRINITY_DN10627_c1_g1_i3.p1 TRINITY_DN10627_c1_g1~~TRINITY_DN10627_c1_g1_i3.p1  ORF type:complete len:530 (+),score=192.21 TRINITY_DN10627_c1_g1_i3:95-1591(+)